MPTSPRPAGRACAGLAAAFDAAYAAGRELDLPEVVDLAAGMGGPPGTGDRGGPLAREDTPQ